MTSDSQLGPEHRVEIAKLYFNCAQASATEYDQRVFWLVAGSAAVFGYLQSKLPEAQHWALPCLLVIGWAAFFIAMVAVMFSFLKASSVHLLWAKSWLWDDNDSGDKAAMGGRIIGRANWVSFVAVFVGVGCHAVFLLVNYF